MGAETRRVVLASGEVREVDVIPQDSGRWAASGRHLRGAGFGGSREEAIARWLTMNGDVREILAPGELTRAELRAQAFREGAEAMRRDVVVALTPCETDIGRLDRELGAIRTLPVPPCPEVSR